MKKYDFPDSFNVLRELSAGSERYGYFSLNALKENGVADVSRYPCSVKMIIESLLRGENALDVTRDDVLQFLHGCDSSDTARDIPFKPARVLLQDFTGVPCVVDLASMRAALAENNISPTRVNPGVRVDLVIDHSIQADHDGRSDACLKNELLEINRNLERYRFLKWAQKVFHNFRIVPPGLGICHQINTEYLSTLVSVQENSGCKILFPDSVIGTDSHTTTVNGLGIAGWGVGGIEAEAVMLGNPLFMPPPSVLGCRLIGRLPPGCFAADVALTITELLRKKGVVGRFVEFFGEGVSSLPVPDRITVANMAPEYGATMGFFPADNRTLDYLRLTGKPESRVMLAQKYLNAQGMFRTAETPEPRFSDVVEIDLGRIRQSVAGPKRPQDRIDLVDVKRSLHQRAGTGHSTQTQGLLKDGAVLIAAITSCTNTGNPRSMVAAGLLAKKAVEAGLHKCAWVKTSLSPGSKTVTLYLQNAGLLPSLEKLGFFVAGYGCMSCIGNSGDLDEEVESGLRQGRFSGAAVVSGNRNFEGRIHPAIKASYLASPVLVVAYAIAGTMDIDFSQEPIGTGVRGGPVYLRDILPDDDEINGYVTKYVNRSVFEKAYADVYGANQLWNEIDFQDGDVFQWDEMSTYLQKAPFFDRLSETPEKIAPINNARVLALLGDGVTTDHISPAGSIAVDSPAGRYLLEACVDPADFNSYGSRRGNHHVMCRGAFANRNLENRLADGLPGGRTVYLPFGEVMSIYDAAMRYMTDQVPVILIAGSDYGMGSSRDWAAKGTYLLGIKAVIARSFERIHRSNLIGMGVLPLQFIDGQTSEGLGLNGTEIYSIALDDGLKPGQRVAVYAVAEDGSKKTITVLCRLDSEVEILYYRNGGILRKVLRETGNWGDG